MARLSDNQMAADRIRDGLMSENLAAAVEWYEANRERADDPLDVRAGSPYKVVGLTEGEKLQKESEDTFAAAKQADAAGDKYNLATVVLALALFFGGIATLLDRPSRRHCWGSAAWPWSSGSSSSGSAAPEFAARVLLPPVSTTPTAMLACAIDVFTIANNVAPRLGFE